MRILLLMRGAPGCGKSTWIKEHHLENYTLSPDNIRIMCSSLELQPDGNFKISQNSRNENEVWNTLFKILEYRMERGEFTVIDATCSKTKDINQYKELADSYRYRMYIVDFTDISLETCLKQNKMRPDYKQVPEESIKNIYSRFATQQIPSGVKIIKRNEFDKILEKPIDLSNYKKLVFIGDIHGCYDTLMQYEDFKNGLRDDTEYIFCGDFLDRGDQNVEVYNFIYNIKDKQNVCLLEGNHECSIKYYGYEVPAKSKEFETNTRKQLSAAEISTKSARELYRKIRQCSHIMYNGMEILACHGGIPNLNTNLLYIPSYTLTHGAGSYNDYLENTDSWMSQTKENQYLIHGHRNTESFPIDIADRVFNLDGSVEKGGKLRILEITQDKKIKCVYLDSIQKNLAPIIPCYKNKSNLEKLTELRYNKFINEKDLGDGISSFNFTREAFYEGNWNNQTILARGLFLNNNTGDIVARSYEKFFKINEVYKTELGSLKNLFKFPVKAYLKYNGFLGICSYLKDKDELFVASKSTNKGDFAEMFKELLEPYKNKILDLFRNKKLKNCSLIFEVINKDKDPHIIEYKENKLVLLDIINNTYEFSKMEYEDLKNIGNYIGCETKELAYILNDYDEFRNLYMSTQEYEYKYNGEYIEGFVFEDMNGFMVKCKSGYYNEWKKLRGFSIPVLRSGNSRKTGVLSIPMENEFFGFLKELYKKYYNKDTKSYDIKTDIISLRNMFEKK